MTKKLLNEVFQDYIEDFNGQYQNVLVMWPEGGFYKSNKINQQEFVLKDLQWHPPPTPKYFQ